MGLTANRLSKFMMPVLYQKRANPSDARHQAGAAGLLCSKTRYGSIAAITHIRFHMCQQIRFALTRDHEPWPGGESRKRDCLWRVPSPLEGRFPTPPLTHSQLTHFPQRPSRDGLRHSQPFGLSPPAKSRMRPSPHTNTPASQATRIFDYRVTLLSI